MIVLSRYDLGHRMLGNYERTYVEDVGLNDAYVVLDVSETLEVLKIKLEMRG